MDSKGMKSIEALKGIHRDQLITVSDLEVFTFDLIREIKNILKDTSGSNMKKWLKSSEVCIYVRIFAAVQG